MMKVRVLFMSRVLPNCSQRKICAVDNIVETLALTLRKDFHFPLASELREYLASVASYRHHTALGTMLTSDSFKGRDPSSVAQELIRLDVQWHRSEPGPVFLSLAPAPALRCATVNPVVC
jgi:hypothetical protein